MFHRFAPAFWATALAVVLTTATAHATPTTVGYDGRILDSTGTAVNSQTTVRISLHTHATNSAEVWFETHIITPEDGYFHVDLGDSSSLVAPLADNAALWIETAIAGTPHGPRQRLNAVPYAIQGDTLADLQCSDGDAIRYNGTTSSWECRTTGFSQFSCIPTAWDYTTGVICSTTVTLSEPSMVFATVTGHWYATTPSCTLEILFGSEGVNSQYTAKNGLHTYASIWDDLAFTRAVPLAAGSHVVRYATQGNCKINGSGLHGYIIPQ